MELPLDVAKIISEGPYRELPTAECLDLFSSEIDKQIPSLSLGSDPLLFGRLSTRSPKDAVMWDDESIEAFIIEPLSHVNLEDKNAVSVCVWEGMRNGLVSRCGKDIIKHLLRSDRSAVDCSREIERGSDYDMNVIIREWKQLPIDFEFRCFFTKRTINAITQYFNNCYFHTVVENKEEIEGIILSQWDLVKGSIPFDNGIVDFVVDWKKRTAYIIEFNPLDLFTGSGLFDYYEDWDVVVGNKPREFRVVSSLEDKALQHELEGNVSSFDREIRKAREKQKVYEYQQTQGKDSCHVM